MSILRIAANACTKNGTCGTLCTSESPCPLAHALAGASLLPVVSFYNNSYSDMQIGYLTTTILLSEEIQ